MTEPFKIDQEYDVNIERMSFGPRAVARIHYTEGDRPLVVFVEGAAPGDRARIRLTHQHKNYWEAEIVEVLTASNARTQPLCRHFGTCGGCQWQHLTYEAQLAAKKEILLHQIEKTTKVPRSELETILNVHGASSPWGYRTRAQVRGQGRNMGFFEKHSRNLVAIEECPVLHPKIMEQWKRFRKEKAPELAGPNKEFKVEWTLRESGKVTEAVNQPHAALGFTQINSEGNATLKKIVETAAMRTTTKDLLWDLYGGTGNLVDLLIPSFETTLTVDAENQGVRYSSEQNETSGHTVVKAKTKTFLQLWSQSKDPKHPNCIVVDPPRTGLEDNAEKIAEVGAERVILVSCDPASLARDLTKFLALYEIRSLDLIDMFPQTYHLESVVELVRR